MARTGKKRSSKVGLPPGSLVHIGEKKSETVRIMLMHYDAREIEEKDAVSADECIAYRDQPAVTWIHVAGVHQPELLEKLGTGFGLHPLVIEDILNTDQRPKLEDHGDYAYVVLKRIYTKEERVGIEQISLILGPNFVLSFEENRSGVFDAVRNLIRKSHGRIRRVGADYLVYALMDAVVDNYFGVLERLGERVEELEEDLIIRPTHQVLQRLHNLKREMLFLRRFVWPLREVVAGLERGKSALVKEDTWIYLRDVYDHTIHVIDSIETFREMLSGMLDMYLSSVSNRMNEIMKVLTIIATLFIPLTFVTGIYGMNFKHMPELEWYWGYPAVLLMMVAVVAGMLRYFRKKNWL